MSSALNGVVSGSSVSNVVSGGIFTIPLMKRTGYSGVKAGAIEAASSINGQIMPPVMGAAAFLMVEYVGIPYSEIIKHAALPAVISYIALFYIVHLEALKLRPQADRARRAAARWRERMLGWAHRLRPARSLALRRDLLRHHRRAARCSATRPAGRWRSLTLVAYVVLLGVLVAPPRPADRRSAGAGRAPAAALADGARRAALLHPDRRAAVVPDGRGAVAGHCRPSGRTATTMAMVVAAAGDAVACSAGHGARRRTALRQGVADLWHGLVLGARNMIGIAVACASAGLIVGAITLTGMGLMMTDFVELVSAGNVLLMLVLTAVICLLIGAGVPTTANYILVATLMAPVIVELGARSGLVIPLIARAPVRLLLRHHGRRDAAGRAWPRTPPRRSPATTRTPPAGRPPGTACAPRCCRSSSSSIRSCC